MGDISVPVAVFCGFYEKEDHNPLKQHKLEVLSHLPRLARTFRPNKWTMDLQKSEPWCGSFQAFVLKGPNTGSKPKRGALWVESGC